MSDRTVRDVFEGGLILAALIGFTFFFFVTDFSSTQASTDTLGRFVYAMISVIAPTSTFDVLVSAVVAIVGGVAVGRENLAAGILITALLYGTISFAIGWITAPM